MMKYLACTLLALAAIKNNIRGRKLLLSRRFNIKYNYMDNINILFTELYNNFNDRKIGLVISKMTDNVKWANGMDGGYVYGHDGVKEY